MTPDAGLCHRGGHRHPLRSGCGWHAQPVTDRPVSRLLHGLLSGHVRSTGCAGGAPLTGPTDRARRHPKSQAIQGSDPTSGAPPFSLAIQVARRSGVIPVILRSLIGRAFGALPPPCRDNRARRSQGTEQRDVSDIDAAPDPSFEALDVVVVDLPNGQSAVSPSTGDDGRRAWGVDRRA